MAAAIGSAWALIANADTAPPPSHCTAGEGIYFSCELGKKLVSLCATRRGDETVALAYRYGSARKIELEYLATAGNGRHFLGDVAPAGPRASVEQVWFTLGKTRYVLTTCVGGDCPHQGGLAVLRGNQVLKQQACAYRPDDSDTFSADLVHFGSDLSDSRSKTPLLRLEPEDNLVFRLYGSPRRPKR